jgi:hypothetical protein
MGGKMAAGLSCRMEAVPVLLGRAGPGHTLPPGDRVEAFYPFPRPLVVPLTSPIAVVLAKDDHMAPLFQDRDLILVDRAEAARSQPDPAGIYLISSPQGTLVRYVRAGGRSLYLAAHNDLQEPRRWNYLSLAGQNILEIVRGRIVWIGRKVEVFPSEPLKKAG